MLDNQDPSHFLTESGVRSGRAQHVPAVTGSQRWPRRVALAPLRCDSTCRREGRLRPFGWSGLALWLLWWTEPGGNDAVPLPGLWGCSSHSLGIML